MLGHVGEVAESVDEVLHVAGRLTENLAGVERLDLGDDRLVLLDGVGEPLEEPTGREIVARDRRIEIVMVAAGRPPEGDPARIGHLHRPSAAGRDRPREQPLEPSVVAAGRRGEHRRIVGGEQVDALVEDR